MNSDTFKAHDSERKRWQREAKSSEAGENRRTGRKKPFWHAQRSKRGRSCHRKMNDDKVVIRKVWLGIGKAQMQIWHPEPPKLEGRSA